MTVQPPANAAEGVDYFTVTGADLRMFRCVEHQATLSTKGCATRWLSAQGARGIGELATAATESLYAAKQEIRANTHGKKQAYSQRLLAVARDRIKVVRDQAASYDACRGCPIGAAHAGRTAVTVSRDFGSDRCPRCGYGTTRMINNRICVSCSNREHESIRGVNGRGNVPKRLPPIVHLELRYTVDGVRVTQERRTVAAAHVARVRNGKDRHGKVQYLEHERGGVAEAIFQTLRTTKGRVDFQPLVTAPEVAMQGLLFPC